MPTTLFGIRLAASARRAGLPLGFVLVSLVSLVSLGPFGSLGVLGAGPAQAMDIQWANATGGSWGTPGNWSPPQVPGEGDRALITLAGTYTVTIAFADVPLVDEVVVGGSSGEQTLLLADDTSLTAVQSLQVGATGVIRLQFEAYLTANGVAQNLGRIEADNAQIQADLGLNNAGTLELTDSSILGAVTNGGTLRTIGTVGLSSLTNDSGGSVEVIAAPSIFPGATMDTLINRGHVTVGTSANLIAAASLTNEPFAVLALDGTAQANGQLVTNAGVIRAAAGARVTAEVYEQLASGELVAHYSASVVQYCVLAPSVVLDGSVSPVFDPGFTPSSGDLPLAFAQTVSGQFAIVNSLGTGGRAVEVIYLVDAVQLRVTAPGLAVFPPFGGEPGSITITITGSELASVLAVRLHRDGESDIVAEPIARDAETGIVAARFDLTGHAHGVWDVVLDGPGEATETATDAFSIQGLIPVPIRVDIIGRDRLRSGGSSTWTIGTTNPSNGDVVGSVQIDIPPGLRWELITEHLGSEPSRVSGQFDQETGLIVPGVVAPPGMNLTGVKLRLSLPAAMPLGGGTLRARWFGP